MQQLSAAYRQQFQDDNNHKLGDAIHNIPRAGHTTKERLQDKSANLIREIVSTRYEMNSRPYDSEISISRTNRKPEQQQHIAMVPAK
jgi:hypothetical protein